MFNGYLEIIFDVSHAATNNRYADGNDKRLIYLGIIALFTFYKLRTSSGKHLETIDHAHIVFLMYKHLSTCRGSDDLSIGFDRSRDRRQRELTNNKNIKGRYLVRIYLKDLFGFAEHQEKGTYWLVCKLTLTKNSDNAVLNKANATNKANNKKNALEWYVPQYTPSLEGFKK